ncbi:MAG: glycosyltransferase family 2 protein [Putridiphycobacter sp.]
MVTVLIPNYNNEPYLIDCLNSILNQSYQKFDILIVDDGSTDKSLDIIKGFSDKRINLIQKKENSGIIDTLNIGLKHIQSKYIVRMDADDLMSPNRIEKLVHFMEENPEIGVCGSGIQQFGLSDQVIIYERNPKQNKANLLFHHSVGHASVIYRNNILKSNSILYSQGYNYIEDYKIFYDLSKVTNITSIPDVLYYYRREDYNNYKNQDIKKEGYFKIYTELLNDLNVPITKQILEIHYEIAHNTSLTFSKNEYFNHIKTIQIQNHKLKLFPKKELNHLLQQKKVKLLFQLIDNKRVNMKNSFFDLVFKPKVLYYYLRS